MDNDSQTTTPLADPAITAVKDSAGTPLTNPGTTEDTELTLSGVAPANSVVLLFENGVPIGSASVTINGTWEKSAIAELGEHRFTVRVTGGPESLPWVITVETIAVPPTITNVVDSGGEVIHEGTTFDDAVLVGGSAAAGKTVEFLHNGASIGDVLVDTNGLWTQVVTGLTAGRHDFQVRARYGNNPVSNIRTLTAAVAAAPTIESIKDDADVEIPAGATTFSSSVTMTGTAVAGQQVEIYDGSTLKGTVPATNGTWTLPLSGLAVKAYSFKARGLYGSNPESAARGFTIAAATAPTITSVKDAAGNEIPEGGTTSTNRVTLTGTAASGQQVQILDGTTVLGTATSSGVNWTFTLPSLTVKAYNVKAKGLYGSEPVSQPRTFTVRAPTPALVIDTSPLTLNGHMIRVDQLPPNPPVNTYATRAASGGVAPYTYSVSNTDILDIVASTGRIVTRRNGSATVTVRDSAGQTAHYQVSVSNVYLIGGAMGFTWWRDANEHAASLGGSVPSLADWNMFRAAYGNAPPISNDQAWSIDQATALTRWVINPVDGQLGQRHTGFTGPNTAAGWAVIPGYP